HSKPGVLLLEIICNNGSLVLTHKVLLFTQMLTENPSILSGQVQAADQYKRRGENLSFLHSILGNSYI
ncbi:hypothetical protein, partial [Paenochrobactrum gallinarii]|uniref:hypothetical protein n=1 Tax=Paenochrobactrum gallinarii TaxID=643673 RepID=UPI0035BBE7F4